MSDRGGMDGKRYLQSDGQGVFGIEKLRELDRRGGERAHDDDEEERGVLLSNGPGEMPTGGIHPLN